MFLTPIAGGGMIVGGSGKLPGDTADASWKVSPGQEIGPDVETA